MIHSIEQQGMLTNELQNDILKQTKLQRVEDLYRPYKQKKKHVQLKQKKRFRTFSSMDITIST